MDITKQQLLNFGFTGVEAAVSAIPVLGGPLQTMIFGTLNAKKIANLEEYINTLSRKITNLEHQLILNNKPSDEQLGIMETIFEEVPNFRSVQKHDYYANAAINVLSVHPALTVSEAESFIFILGNISVSAVSTLRSFDNRPSFEERTSESVESGDIPVLKSLGLIVDDFKDIRMYGNRPELQYRTHITSLGHEFLTFIGDYREKDDY
ncbi:hypothetical protein [Weissella confusa]|uniref:hypothetical protein n=1 Tax=Weissella confusa TaxID=1583 RepID=UPI0002465C58|nr:hypothetical protein [Weissella confusa]MBJ7616567.1 hypothetical protein [Weissella confusa]MBJ7627304.1 hypothetical protein [Weissella confusa]CCF29784.1 Putative uncharacterized protein [Weissella confusa LBAE C39-2]